MARNERRGHLDKSTRHHLSALDAYIQEQVAASQPRQESEFTLIDYMEKMRASGIEILISTAKRHMQTLIDEKKISKRSLVIKGCKTNLYKFI